MKKIIILGPAHPLRGGIASSSERLAQAFQAEGHEVELFSFYLQYPNFLFPGKTQYINEPAPADLSITSNVNSVNPFNWIKIGLKIKNLKPDIVICRFWLPFMGPCFGTILRLARSNGHTKVVSIADNIIPHEKRIGDYWLTRYFTGAVNRFIVMSKSVEEDMKQFTTTKSVKYIPHPIYDNYGEIVEKGLAKSTLKLDENQDYMLFFGFIRAYKGLDLLLEAMADKRVRALGVQLIVAGEYYGNQEQYEEMINRLGIRDNLVLHDEFISSEAVKYYFCASDIVVQPYKTATQSGISQLAYHFEKPMLVTRVGGLPEIVPDGEVGYVVDVDVKAIADGIVDFYEQKREQKFIEGVKVQKKRFSWGNMVNGVLD